MVDYTSSNCEKSIELNTDEQIEVLEKIMNGTTNPKTCLSTKTHMFLFTYKDLMVCRCHSKFIKKTCTSKEELNIFKSLRRRVLSGEYSNKSRSKNVLK